jgi:type IV pilus assembly protein PilN
MRISINLATRPFVELRPLFARLRLAMAGLAVLAVALGVWLHFLNKKAQVEQAYMDSLKAQTTALQNERQKNEARMREPQNYAVLQRSKFLNTLFATKSFSWTSVMMDLERVLPPGVQVTSIEPVITGEHDVSIHMRVSGDRDRTVDLIRNLERSQRFLVPRPINETAQTQEHGAGMTPVAQVGVPGGVEFEILSGYNPLPTVDKATLAREKAAQDAPAQKDESTGHKPAAPTHKAAAHTTTTPVPGKPAKRGAQ